MYNKNLEDIQAMNEQPQHKLDTPGRIDEVKGDILDFDGEYAIAYFLGAGGAPMDRISWVMDMKYKPKFEPRPLPHCYVNEFGNILIMMYNEFDESSVDRLLLMMRDTAYGRRIHKIAIPHYNQEIKHKVMNVFMGTDFDIKIVYNEDYYKGKIIEPDLEKQNFKLGENGEPRYKYY